MRVHIEINIPYSLTEIFSREAHRRASELRAEAEKLYGQENLSKFVCTQSHCFDGKSPLELSVSSPENHQRVMLYLRYGGDSYG